MIENIKIERLFGSKNINWTLQKTNVLVGKNGTGKSTILELIHATLNSNIQSQLDENIFWRIIIEDNKKRQFFSFPNAFAIPLDDKSKELLNRSLEKNSAVNRAVSSFIFGGSLALIGGGIISAGLIGLAISTILGLKNKTNSRNNTKFIKVEFIKTQNIFENSKVSDSIDGKQYALIDFLMQKELERISDKENLNALENTLNVFFNETNSIIEIENNNIIVKKDNKEISLNQLSSGEKQVIYIMIKAMIAKETGALLLMDEPEISLHLSWQKKLLTEIRKINDVSQIIVVTHSPAIVVGKWFDSFIDIKDITTEINTEVGSNS